ncbi:hypothetical protein ACISU4_06595 [Streptomyces wuyuanensis]|uniref:hypothetical protein n=1 Tax=Streptomyces wuyuanensis TaxID=1196353 RepID=UPI00382AEDCB
MDARENQHFRKFVASKSPGLLHVAMRHSGGDQPAAEDLLQDALMKTAKRWHRIDEPEAYVREMLCRRQARRLKPSERSAGGAGISAAGQRIHGAPSTASARPEAAGEQPEPGALKADAPEVRLSDDFAERVHRSLRRRKARSFGVAGVVAAIIAVGVAVPLTVDGGGKQGRPAGEFGTPSVMAHADQSPPRELVAAGRIAVSAYYTTKLVKQSNGDATGTYEWSLLNAGTGRYEKTDWAWLDVASGMQTAAVLERDLPVNRIGLLELATGKVKRWIEVDKRVGGVQFSPDGKRLVATTYSLHPDGFFKDMSYQLNDKTVPGPKPSRTGYYVIDVASGQADFAELPSNIDESSVGPGGGRQDLRWSLDGKLVWEAWGNKEGGIYYDLNGNQMPVPKQEASLPSPGAVLSRDGKLVTGAFAGKGDQIVSEVLDTKTGRRAALVPGQQLLAWADDNHLIAWRCDPEQCSPGEGEFRNQLLLVGLDGQKTIPLSGFRKAKLRYDGRWTPMLTQR